MGDHGLLSGGPTGVYVCPALKNLVKAPPGSYTLGLTGAHLEGELCVLRACRGGVGTGFGPSGSHWGDPAPRILIAEVTSKEALPAAQPLLPA